MQTRNWRLAHGRTIELGRRSVLMGVLNVTPDSFSDGGDFLSLDAALAQARRMVDEGASIIDIGGESTRPGAAAVRAAQEQDRVLPVIEACARELDVAISIDTYRSDTAAMALKAGAHIVNDVWGLQREPQIASVAATAGAGVVIMHTGRGRALDPDPIADQHVFLRQSLNIAGQAGLPSSAIVLDPGFGFAKETAEANLDLMARFGELHAIGYPLLAGTSRKRFIGTVTGREASDRDAATAATSVVLRLAGAVIFRVHNVAINRDALMIADAMMERGVRLGRDRE